ncbi:MAG: RNA ligase family protein, partial [Planctomycetota bacterium]
GSRKRWITPDDDNFGFARWVRENIPDLFLLGEGHHFGEWWGAGIQRKYGQSGKIFSLFNVHQWADETIRPHCCSVVPTLYRGPNSENAVRDSLRGLALNGSVAAPGFMDPEGVVVYHRAANKVFKVTIKNDEAPKSVM